MLEARIFGSRQKILNFVFYAYALFLTGSFISIGVK